MLPRKSIAISSYGSLFDILFPLSQIIVDKIVSIIVLNINSIRLFSSLLVPQCIVCLEAFLLWKAFNMTPIKGLCDHDSCWHTNSSPGIGLQPMIQEGEGKVISCRLKESFNYLYLQVRSLKLL